MRLIEWSKLPEEFKTDKVKVYYDIIKKKEGQLLIKRSIDIILSCIGAVILLPFMILIAILIKLNSRGPIIFKQVRVTQYGKTFKIFKFRTMVVNAESMGTQVTSKNDPRVTTIGRFLRKVRLDELPQIFNIIKGDLSFVGTRPEVPKYVDKYTDEMIATLLLPAGVTSIASIEFKDEEKLLDGSKDVDGDYVNSVLPIKMRYNLEYTKQFTWLLDIKIIFKTVKAVIS